MFVEWRPEYASGNGDIDAMHRLIVDRLACVGRAVEEGRGAGAAFRDLRTAVLDHFHAEDRLLEMMGATASAGHRREHGHLARLLADGQALCDDDARAAAVPTFVDVVSRWLIHEITANDRHLVTFLAARGRARVHPDL